MIKVSVLMITYNHEKFIEEAVLGVLNQKCNFEFELVIANDNSPDNTDIVIRKLLEKSANRKRIKYTKHKNNKGPNSNFMWAFNNSSGKYIAMCEGDDYWTDPKKLQKQVDFLDNNLDYNICVHNTDTMKDAELLKKEWRWDPKRTTFTAIDYIYSLFFHTSSAIFRKEASSKNILHPNILQGDMALFLSVINDKKVFFMEESMSVYRLHPGGITNSPNHKSYELEYKSLLYILEKFNFLSNYKFRNVIWLKKQTIKSLIFIFDQTKEKKIKPFVRFKYYLFKIVLLTSVKIYAKLNGFKLY